MRRTMWMIGVAVYAGLLAGCVERRYVITSNPPGAAVYRNGQFIGLTPVDDQFVYYGDYHFTIRKDGYATLQVRQPIPMPWYEYWPLEFVSENLVPGHIENIHRFDYTLQPLPQPNIQQLLNEAQILRSKGKAIGPPAPPPAPPGLVEPR
ncbi:MAG TPA: PEGA domain-containing protein [Gemmataceae bacterium]|nr:PEGA domain-containing protein [Gemmataceae bacterium]